MLAITVLVTLVLSGLRLYGVNNPVFVNCSYAFGGALVGYLFGGFDLAASLCAFVFFGTEAYVIARRFFPNLPI